MWKLQLPHCLSNNVMVFVITQNLFVILTSNKIDPKHIIIHLNLCGLDSVINESFPKHFPHKLDNYMAFTAYQNGNALDNVSVFRCQPPKIKPYYIY